MFGPKKVALPDSPAAAPNGQSVETFGNYYISANRSPVPSVTALPEATSPWNEGFLFYWIHDGCERIVLVHGAMFPMAGCLSNLLLPSTDASSPFCRIPKLFHLGIEDLFRFQEIRTHISMMKSCVLGEAHYNRVVIGVEPDQSHKGTPITRSLFGYLKHPDIIA